jgi:hypothetical protein
MERQTVQVPVCHCRRCGHRWIARTAERPVCCAACKSPRWNVPARWKRRRRRTSSLEIFDDPVVGAYKAGIDLTLIRENIGLSVDERFIRLGELHRFSEELRRAGAHAVRRR